MSLDTFLAPILATDEEAITVLLDTFGRGMLGRALTGKFRIRRHQGDDVLVAFEKTLDAFLTPNGYKIDENVK
mgnify:CR=1 FL=1